MQSALNKYTGEIVEAEELWLLDIVDHDAYVCQGCGVKVTPASYRPENLVRPYFTSKIEEHIDCDVHGEEKLIAKGRKERVSHPRNGFPGRHYTRLVLKDQRLIVDTGRPANNNHSSTERDKDSNPFDINLALRKRKADANTIRPLCRHFMNFPYDRDLSLEIPGIDAYTYQYVFKKLKWNALSHYPDRRIFYAPMRWNRPIETDNYMEIALDAGDREGSRLKLGHRVQINWKNWSNAKRRAIEQDIVTMIAKAREDELNKKEKAYLFFIGEQDQQDITLFHVHDHRLVCGLFGEIIYPQRGG